MDDIDSIQKFNLGNDFFENPWVAGSASTSSRDGLGGLFNNNAYQDATFVTGVVMPAQFLKRKMAQIFRVYYFAQRGKTLFNEVGCGGCHVEQYTTSVSEQHPDLSEQIIFPYTDLLLHDLGEDLSDFVFTENLGMAKVVDPEVSFLHDGRARTVTEAVIWHGGEAESSKQNVLSFDEAERAAFLAFLNDL